MTTQIVARLDYGDCELFHARIRLVRRATGAGWRECKDLIEALPVDLVLTPAQYGMFKALLIHNPEYGGLTLTFTALLDTGDGPSPRDLTAYTPK